MEIPCNVSMLLPQTQLMDSSVFYLIKVVSHCTSLSLNTLLSIPLLMAVTQSPSLLTHTRFLLLTHLLCCDDLQLLVWTVKAVLLFSQQGLPVVQCLVLSATSNTLSLIELLLSTLLAVDRCVAIKCPLRYGLLPCTRRSGALLAAVWTSSALVGSLALGFSLSTLHALHANLPRCHALILAPCLAPTSPLILFHQVSTGVLLTSCYLTMLGCFFMVCWDARGSSGDSLRTRRAGVTLALQATQMLFYSVPLVMESYLILGSMHCDTLDIVAAVTYNLGISLIPLVYGYRSRELQQRILQTARCMKRNRIDQGFP